MAKNMKIYNQKELEHQMIFGRPIATSTEAKDAEVDVDIQFDANGNPIVENVENTEKEDASIEVDESLKKSKKKLWKK